MPKELDLVGKRFGKLQVLKKAPTRGGKTYWTCQCECGCIKDIRGTSLTSGVTKGCGCSVSLNNSNSNPNFSEEPIERLCLICRKNFYTNIRNRKYCYDCSPTEGIPKTERRKALKRALVEYKGGKCEICGYHKCIGALQFHHIDPKNKKFSISHYDFTEETINSFYEEVDKCQLLCANCHAEVHSE